jgi:membrane protease subunit (stomatin/prohibitin family)
MKIADVIKYEGDNSAFIWKHPREDFNCKTKLIVNKSQEAVFFTNGQALDLFDTGHYTLNTQNTPEIGSVLGRSIGDTTPFHCELYFVNKTVQMRIGWETDSRVHYVDPQTGIPLELGAIGSMDIQVADSRKLLMKLEYAMTSISLGGTATGISCEAENDYFTKLIQNLFGAVVLTSVKTMLPSTIKSLGINILEVNEHLSKIAQELHSRITPAFEEYGITISHFYLTTVVLPENDPNFKRIREMHIKLRLKNCEVGDVIRFGLYPHEKKQVKESIEWLVLAKENDKILVISKYALDCKQYDTG